MHFKDDALQQAITAMPGYKAASKEFLALDQLNYLTFFLLSAMDSLTLAEQYNSDPSLSANQQTRLAQSLFRDAIMSYAKCFASAESKKLKLDFNQIVKSLTHDEKVKYRKTHDEMLKIRNSYIAHNLDNDYELSTVATKIENNILYIKPVFTIQIPVGRFKNYFEQCGLVQNYLIGKIHDALTKIKSEIHITVEFG